MALRGFASRTLSGLSWAFAGGSTVTLAAYLSGDEERKSRVEFAAGRLAQPFAQLLDAEDAHSAAVEVARRGWLPKERRPVPQILRTRVFGLDFDSPLGLAAGFDKDAVAIDGMLGLGFGSVEIGSVTPEPQAGNPKPRVWRLASVGGVINRYGFNSKGADFVEQRLLARAAASEADASEVSKGVVGVNLGKNRSTTEEDAAKDYCKGIQQLGPYADYLVVNVSSPNTPGLRDLQSRKKLQSLCEAALKERDALPQRPALLIKVAPDLDEADLADVARVALQTGVDGIVVSNTTVARPEDIRALPHGSEAGGLSGQPLRERSTAALAALYRLTGGKVPLVGAGGIASGEAAYDKIRAGASLLQLYSSLALEGVGVVPRIHRELAALLALDGYASVADAVGADHDAAVRAGAAAVCKKKSENGSKWMFWRR